MVFAPVDPAIRGKVIESHLAGKGRNQIARELNEQGMKVSHGSVSNFINAYKRQHEQPSQPPQSSQTLGLQPEADARISTGIDMSNTNGSSLLMARDGSGTGQAVITNSNSNVIPRDGGPLSHLLCEDNSTDEDEISRLYWNS